jgi:hypothetical protein
MTVPTWRKQDGKGDADQSVGRADGEIEVLVDDDEGHAHGHDRIARGVAQHRVKGLAAAEESRIDQCAPGKEHGHQNDEAEFPAADELRGRPPEPGLKGVRHRFPGLA